MQINMIVRIHTRISKIYSGQSIDYDYIHRFDLALKYYNKLI